MHRDAMFVAYLLIEGAPLIDIYHDQIEITKMFCALQSFHLLAWGTYFIARLNLELIDQIM